MLHPGRESSADQRLSLTNTTTPSLLKAAEHEQFDVGQSARLSSSFPLDHRLEPRRVNSPTTPFMG
jgi:hypothetical protein